VRVWPKVAAVAAASVLLLAGCAAGDSDPNASSAPAAEAGPELTGELTVFAAASLKAAFDELETQFEARHPSLEVLPVVYDGSSTLAAQLIEGAPADVFASADENNMQKVAGAGLASESIDHGAFDNEGKTLESLRHIIG